MDAETVYQDMPIMAGGNKIMGCLNCNYEGIPKKTMNPRFVQCPKCEKVYYKEVWENE